MRPLRSQHPKNQSFGSPRSVPESSLPASPRTDLTGPCVRTPTPTFSSSSTRLTASTFTSPSSPYSSHPFLAQRRQLHRLPCFRLRSIAFCVCSTATHPSASSAPFPLSPFPPESPLALFPAAFFLFLVSAIVQSPHTPSPSSTCTRHFCVLSLRLISVAPRGPL